MKKDKIIYWSTTTLIFLFEGVMPALFSQSEEAKEGMRHLGYPDYFGIMLAVFKVIGALVLILPQAPKRIKEWAYVGFGIDFICASISYMAVEGFSGNVVFPLIVFAVLAVSYVYFHKLNDTKTT